MNEERIKLAIFDMAGTTVYDKNNVQNLLIRSFNNFDIDVTPQQIRDVMGLEKGHAIKQILDQARLGSSKIILADDILRFFNNEAIGYYLEFAKPVPYALTLFKKLKSQGILVALNTGFSEAVMNCIINSLDWNEYIDARISSEQVKAGRPFPFMIDALRKMTRVENPAQIAKIGDTPSDLFEGDRASCGINIGIYSSRFSKEVLQTLPHTHLVSGLKGCAPILLQ